MWDTTLEGNYWIDFGNESLTLWEAHHILRVGDRVKRLIKLNWEISIIGFFFLLQFLHHEIAVGRSDVAIVASQGVGDLKAKLFVKLDRGGVVDMDMNIDLIEGTIFLGAVDDGLQELARCSATTIGCENSESGNIDANMLFFQGLVALRG